MTKRKLMKERGKIRFSEYFKDLKTGDTVAIKQEQAVASNVPARMQGRTGKVIAKRGNAYVVLIKDFNQEKTYIVPAIHLKRITSGVKVK